MTSTNKPNYLFTPRKPVDAEMQLSDTGSIQLCGKGR
jgi:hypothetical protein